MSNFGQLPNVPVRDAIVKIIEASGISIGLRSNLVEGIVEKRSWETVSPVLEELMRERKSTDLAEVFAGVYFSAALERKEFSCDRVVALLLLSGVTSGSDAYNQMLSMCVEAKGVEYQKYSPEDDPAVKAEIGLLNEAQGKITESLSHQK
jgi:hypothetical protein